MWLNSVHAVAAKFEKQQRQGDLQDVCGGDIVQIMRPRRSKKPTKRPGGYGEDTKNGLEITAATRAAVIGWSNHARR
jgi:hypothetical protein